MEFLGTQYGLAQLDILWLGIPALLIVFLQIARRRIRLSIALLRIIIILLLLLAFASPYREYRERSEQLSAVVDISGSIPTPALTAFAERLAEFSAESRQLVLYTFAANSQSSPAVLEGPQRAEAILKALQSPEQRISRDATNIASAIESVAPSSVGPVLLATDGHETAGDSAKVAEVLGSQRRPIYPLLIDEKLFRARQLEIANLYAPVTAQAGERVTVYSSIRNSLTSTQEATLEFWLDNTKLSEKRIRIPAGQEERVEIETEALEGGLKRIRTVLKPGDGSEIVRHRWISVKEKSKLLVIHGSTEDQQQLRELISLKGYAAEHIVATGSAQIPVDFKRFSAVVINNAARHQLPAGFLEKLEQFSRQGGGVLLIGGDKSFGLGNYIDTPLEKLSPLKFVPPQTEKKRLKVAIALVLDKSGSMAEQDRLLGAKRAIAQAIDSLQDEDFITVICFDHAPFVLIDITPVSNAKEQVDRRLRSLTAAGQTSLLPALAAARQRLARADAGRKHMIVLSDGQFPLTTDAYVEEINRIKRDKVTISAVALGSEADVPFMKFLSKTGNGSFHQTLDASTLPNIFIEDIKVATGERTMAERELFPIGIGPGGLASVAVKRYPPLKGFVETLPKRGSTLELITRRGEKVQPILASWQYGTGRVAAFTSDVNGRWSQPWLRWPDFVRFWSELLDWIRSGDTGKAGDIDFDIRYSLSQGSLALELLIYDQKLRREPAAPIQARLIEPGNEQSSPVFSMAAPGRFEAILPSPRPGDYTLSLKYGTVDLPPVGITLHDDSFGEQPGRGIQYTLLEQIAERSGGVLNPSPQSLPFQANETVQREELFKLFAALAFLLVLIEAFLRELWLKSRT